jgi:hypothetical protein
MAPRSRIEFPQSTSILSLGFKYLNIETKNIGIRSQYQYPGYWTFNSMQYQASQ